ncbi:ABC transporter permease [Streptomyces pactum]|uniref:ABC transporter permease n=1 Tax=Streptomyces pactum TaxID=68249 RepID=A0ABS0NKU0_9ACTN|nr:ABC transporter permease [Streptomyces pactum]MBH5335817.1 ABC transporter permease [Streptomyces pactum]
MLTLALNSVRQRPGRFLATALSAFLGAVITMTFNSLHDTAVAADTDAAGSETLHLTASVVGGYGTLLVFFAIASALTVNVRQRAEEIRLLRCTGATPAQIRLMVVGEAVAVALIGLLAAVGPAMLAGRALLEMFRDTDQVADDVTYTFGPVAVAAGVTTVLVASAGAAFLAVRRATRAAAGAGAGARRHRLRLLGGVAALLIGTASAATTFAMDAGGPELMAPPAYGAIVLSVAFAAFSPALLRVVPARLEGLVTAVAGVSGYLAVHSVRQRATQLAGVLMPLIVFTGVATATLSMQAAENDALDASGVTRSVEDKNLETLNLVVVGIIVVFACVMLINSLYAATSYRGPEFGRQRLAGAVPGQVLTAVGTEAALLTVVGVFFGTIAALAGTVPFTLVRTDRVLPEQAPWIWLGTVAIGAVATVVTSVATARRSLRTPAVIAARVVS